MTMCAVLCLVAQLCLTLCDPVDCSPSGSSVHGDSPGKNTGVGCQAPLQGIFSTQGLNPGLLHCRQILYCLSHQRSPRILGWVAYPFSRGSSWPSNCTRICFQADSLPSEPLGKPFLPSVQFSRSVVSDSLRPRESLGCSNYPVMLAWVNYWVGQKVHLERSCGKTWMIFLITSKHQLTCEAYPNCCHLFYSVMVVGGGWCHTNGLGGFTTRLCNLLLSFGTSQTSSWMVLLLDITTLSPQTYDLVA